MKYSYKIVLKSTIEWGHKKLTPHQFIFLSSVTIGFTSALAVILLKSFASAVFYAANSIGSNFHFKFLLVLFPVIGIMLTVLFIDVVLKGQFEKGTSKILYAIRRKSSMVPKKQTYSQAITSALTVGMGGSAGLESPIVITGAALGSNYARAFGLDYKTRTLLLACGVSAGIAAAFNAPIAGVLFATEVLLVDIGIAAFIPLIIAAATGALTSNIILSDHILLSFRQQEIFHYENVPFYLLLGIFSGFITVYYSRMFSWIESSFEEWKTNKYMKALTGSLLLILLIYCVPSLFGEGYESIKILSLSNPEQLLNQTLFAALSDNRWALLLFTGSAILLKVMATGLTLGSGGNGGNFAPSLFMGAYLGFFFSQLINLIGISHQLPVSNFTIVGMAGVLSGIFHAPLTAIFLIGEITGGYDLMIPLMIVSSISFAISKNFEKHSVELKVLAKMGHVYTGDKDKDLLAAIDSLGLIEKDSVSLTTNISLGELVKLISSSSQNVFPVLSSQGRLEGLVYLDNIRKILFDIEKYEKVKVKDLMVPVQEHITPGESMESIMRKFDQWGVYILPVLEEEKYIGFISKVKVLALYRSELISSSID